MYVGTNKHGVEPLQGGTVHLVPDLDVAGAETDLVAAESDLGIGGSESAGLSDVVRGHLLFSVLVTRNR